jgi:cytochrome P450
MSKTTEQRVIVEDDSSVDEITREMATLKFRQDPYPMYARMRREHPVYRSSRGIWYLTRYADVDAALRDVRLSKDRERMRRWYAQRNGTDAVGRLQERLGRSMLRADPPDHTRLRKPVSKAFTARQVNGLRPRIEKIADELLGVALAVGPTMDVITALAYPLSITVICELLGVPLSDRARIRAWSRQLVNQSEVVHTVETIQRIERAVEEFVDYLTNLARKRRAEPADDLMSALVAVQDCGDRFTDDELISTCFLLLVAGHETTINLVGNSMLALLRHPGQLRRLRQDPALIRSAIEELLRYDGTVQITTRIVKGEVEIDGQTLSDGEAVFPVLGAANRDPDQFADPDRLDLGRIDNRHLSLSNGPHFCLGAPLARLEGEIAIGTLVRRLPRLRLDTDTLEWRPSPGLRGLEALPVAY